MQELDILNKFKEIDCSPFQNEENSKLERHKKWLNTIAREYPSPQKSFNIGVYIRYFNQTKYENYLEYHKRQFEDTIALCPNWKLVDFYIDEGQRLRIWNLQTTGVDCLKIA